VLHVFAFEETAVVAGDVFFVDPEPGPGQDGAEAGVRVEVRKVGRPPLPGSFYSAQPVEVDAPLLRVDLFESFPAGRGTHDRVHYHPTFAGWEPSMRHFDPELKSDPLGWLARQLSDITRLVAVPNTSDADAIARHAGEIVDAVGRLWATVRTGALDPPEGWESSPSFRLGWL
jgi:hypothetical protein